MNAFRTSLRLFSYAFHALFIFVASAMAVIAMVGEPQTVNFYLLPWEGRTLVWGLLALALIGAAVLFLAVRGRAQATYRIWSLLVLALVVRYFFFSDYAFTPDTGEFTYALCLVLATLLALFGAGVKPQANAG